jgi:hypothetical protein
VYSMHWMVTSSAPLHRDFPDFSRTLTMRCRFPFPPDDY